MTEASRLPELIFTSAAKAAVGAHDENIAFERVVDMVGADVAAALRATTLELYSRAAAIARERGIILADTKFEFGAGADGRLVLGDEASASSPFIASSAISFFKRFIYIIK